MTSQRLVTAEETVEDLVARFPTASGFLLARGVICIRCGEPAWCSVGELLEQKQLDVEAVLAELNAFLGLDRAGA